MFTAADDREQRNICESGDLNSLSLNDKITCGKKKHFLLGDTQLEYIRKWSYTRQECRASFGIPSKEDCSLKQIGAASGVRYQVANEFHLACSILERDPLQKAIIPAPGRSSFNYGGQRDLICSFKLLLHSRRDRLPPA